MANGTRRTLELVFEPAGKYNPRDVTFRLNGRSVGSQQIQIHTRMVGSIALASLSLCRIVS
jgi:hypothetical protein